MFPFGNIVLIVEPAMDEFVSALEKAVERKGAAWIVARDATTAFRLCKQFRPTAALVNAEYRQIVDDLPCSALVYTRAELPEDIVSRIGR